MGEREAGMNRIPSPCPIKSTRVTQGRVFCAGGGGGAGSGGGGGVYMSEHSMVTSARGAAGVLGPGGPKARLVALSAHAVTCGIALHGLLQKAAWKSGVPSWKVRRSRPKYPTLFVLLQLPWGDPLGVFCILTQTFPLFPCHFLRFGLAAPS